MLKFVTTAALAATLVMAPLLAGAQGYPAQDLLSTGTTVVGETLHYPTTGAAKVTASIVTLEPGADTPWHRHPAPLVAYILDGELTVDYGPKGKKIYHKGDTFLEAMEVAHKGMNLGTETVRILAVYLGAEGTPNVALVK